MGSRPAARRFPLLPEVVSGDTADVYFLRTRKILQGVKTDPVVGVTVFAGQDGHFCGVRQVVQLLQDVHFQGELWALPEGEAIVHGESAMQIRGAYSGFGIYETAILGILASCTAWTTAAADIVSAARGIPVVSFGARHLHPNVASIMDYAAVVGGCKTCSTPLGAQLAGTVPSGTMPHAYILILGDTVLAAEAFDATIDRDVARVVLVDTYTDEAVESLRVAGALGAVLAGVRLDTPSERGGVTPGLVREVRARLDLAGHSHVRIVVSGGITPERIIQFREAGAPVDSYGVGSYISGARPIDFTADIREVDGRPISKRGRVPGMPNNPRLKRIQ